ncbi:MAG: SDR family NAD(P)-dependent oxidoreductase [Micromonosporaceae bacterium]|nr:SDR family NAD(P)-dependent oxidoreductase [Micromonosporaceae bacterium]
MTGASTGIGRAVAVRQARAGDKVWALVRNPAACPELVELAESEHLDLALIECDVSLDASVEQAFGVILTADGAVDRLVNNAGVYAGSTLEAHTMDEIRAMFEVNYFGAIRCLKQVLGPMRAAGGGVIVAVTSQSARAILPTWAAYAGSKCALEGSLESVAMEVREFGIRVHIVEPGITLTAMRGKIKPRVNPPAYDRLVTRYRTLVAADRTASMAPDDVAQAIQSVLSDPSSPFRTVVGADAVRNIALRQRLSDEAWVALFAQESDDAFYTTWAQLAGVPDPRSRADESLVDP